MKYLFRLFFLFSLSSFSIAQSPTRDVYVEKSEDGYVVRYDNGSEVRTILETPYEPTIERVGPSLDAIVYGCGSPCNYTYFFDLKRAVLSAPFFLVVAFDPDDQSVLYCDAELSYGSMFGEPDATVIRVDWAPVATPYTAISHAKVSHGVIEFDYLSGKNYEPKTYRKKIAFR